MIVAIDGPAGSGKTSVTKEVARRLGLAMLDTGAMYRAVTYRGLQMGFDLESMTNLDEQPELADVRAKLIEVAQTEPIEFEFDEHGAPSKVLIGGQDVTVQIRTKEVDATVSVVSACGQIREALVEQQRAMAAKVDTVLEGRDIGTVVFPNAEVKVFLTASPEERARRRVAQNRERGVGDTDEAAILEMIKYRDGYDSSRANAPLAKAADAVEIDTTGMDFDEVVARIVELIEQKRA